jgi:predicted CxxxxCH...CXXCH cytochrome family protein
VTPSAPEFHGAFIRLAGWDMRFCGDCHGTAYDGGRTGVSCRTCHAGVSGPENCTTCHGGANNAPPRDLNNNTVRSARAVGAHQVHVLGTARARALICTECHAVPATVYTAGHVDTPSPAEVQFTRELAQTVTNEPGTADYDASLPLFTPSPSYSGGALTCATTYCHGAFKNGNAENAPVWNDTTGTDAACGTCHGDVTRLTLAERARPKSSAEGGTHTTSTNCSGCHADVVSGSGNSIRISNAALHINGRLNVFGSERDY